jgi:hypothetical protein
MAYKPYSRSEGEGSNHGFEVFFVVGEFGVIAESCILKCTEPQKVGNIDPGQPLHVDKICVLTPPEHPRQAQTEETGIHT